MTKKSNKNNDTQNKTLFSVAIILFLAVVVFFGAYQLFAPQTTEGTKSITIEVKDQQEKSSTYTVRTNAEYLIDAMKATPKFTFSGYESTYGLTLITVNGITADWENDNAFWCIYVNGEMGNYGIESQPVYDGDVFQFVYTSLNADA